MGQGVVGEADLLARGGGAGAASSVFFLSPPVTALMAWLVLGDTLGVREQTLTLAPGRHLIELGSQAKER